jgi:hypothetical protein
LFRSIERSISGVQQTLRHASQRVSQMIGTVIPQRPERLHVLSQELFCPIQLPSGKIPFIGRTCAYLSTAARRAHAGSGDIGLEVFEVDLLEIAW